MRHARGKGRQGWERVSGHSLQRLLHGAHGPVPSEGRPLSGEAALTNVFPPASTSRQAIFRIPRPVITHSTVPRHISGKERRRLQNKPNTDLEVIIDLKKNNENEDEDDGDDHGELISWHNTTA